MKKLYGLLLIFLLILGVVYSAYSRTSTLAVGVTDGGDPSGQGTLAWFCENYTREEITLVLSGVTYPIKTSLTVPSNIYLRVMPGATFNIDSGVTLTVYSPQNIVAQPTQQIFMGSGTVAFSVGGSGWVDWWQENTTPGTTDMATAINAAITALSVVNFNDNTYRADSKINLKSNFIINLNNAILKSYVTSGYAIGVADTTINTVSFVTINGSWDGYVQSAATGADGCVDLMCVQKSHLNNLRVVGFTTTKGSREGIGIRLSRGASGSYPGWYNTLYRPHVNGFATGIKIMNYANRSDIYSPKVLQCDDYGIFIDTNGGDNCTIYGGDIGINGDNAVGANIYSNDVRTSVLGTSIEDTSGSGYGIYFDTKGTGYFALARVYASGQTPGIYRGNENGISMNGTANFLLQLDRFKIASSVTDVETTSDGVIEFASGTSRFEGLWRYKETGTRWIPLETSGQTLTYGATIDTDLDFGNVCFITITDGNAFQINNPTNNQLARDVTYIFQNSSGGAAGAITWDTSFIESGSISAPQNGKFTVVRFVRYGAFLYQVSIVDNIN